MQKHLLLQEKKLRELGRKHGVKITLVKSVKNGSVTLEGDADDIVSVTDELMQMMMDMKDRSALDREAELLAKQVAFSVIFVPFVPRVAEEVSKHCASLRGSSGQKFPSGYRGRAPVEVWSHSPQKLTIEAF